MSRQAAVSGGGLDVLVQLRQRRGGERQPRFNSSALHEGQQLVGDLGQDVLGQPGHAEDLVPGSVDVVSERDELEAGRHGVLIHDPKSLRIREQCIKYV